MPHPIPAKKMHPNHKISLTTKKFKNTSNSSKHSLDMKVNGLLPQRRIATQPTIVNIKRTIPMPMVDVFASNVDPDNLNISTA